MKRITQFDSFRFPQPLLLAFLIFLPLLIYYPGINGPFILDDIPSLVLNKNIHINQPSLEKIRQAANSNDSGILGRPIPAMSFALNYYFSQSGMESSYGFKLFNIIIHTINGLMVLWFVRLILIRINQINPGYSFNHSSTRSLTLLASGIALYWLVQPIQLTSVLYVVQRMTSMSAFFILFTLISFIQARNAIIAQKKPESIVWAALIPTGFLLSLLSKETGLLIPIYIIILELSLYSGTSPWSNWKKINPKTRVAILALTGLFAASMLTMVVIYSLPGYQMRNFSLFERLLTESRILVFYIGQILLPSPHSFGIHHDDFQLSHSLLQPATTLVSIIFIATLIFLAFLKRRKQPLLSLGIIWFFSSHLIESTVFPLDLVFEHRNYLASLGVILVIIHILLWIHQKYQLRRIWLLLPVFIALLSSITAVRSHQWRNIQSLLEAQVLNHPASARSWSDLSTIQTAQNMPEAALFSATRAALLNPHEPGYFAKVYLQTMSSGTPIPDFLEKKITKAITKKPDSIIFTNILVKMNECIDSSCKDLQSISEAWLRTALKATDSARFHYYLGNNLASQGRLDEGLEYINLSIKQDPNHLSPYIRKIDVLLKQGKIDESKKTYNTLESVSRRLYKTLTNKVLETGKRISKFELQSSRQRPQKLSAR